MTDLEMTKLCAEAMGYKLTRLPASEPAVRCTSRNGPEHNTAFDPLHDDAQAMALVKNFRLEILPDDTIYFRVRPQAINICVQAQDLNRAIVECVARMQEAAHGR